MTYRSITQDAEQEYFDRAWQARESARYRLLRLGGLNSDGSRVHSGPLAQFGSRQERQLAAPTESVAVGRIDHNDESIYVGMNAILSDEHDVLVASWKAPIARLFYESSPNNRLQVELKRSFLTVGNRIVSITDDFSADQPVLGRVIELPGGTDFYLPDTLLAELEAGRTAHMSAIVETIQKDQYKLIRTSRDGILVIEGGPGTGKTAVLLHRVSYLIYNHSDELGPNDLLVIGPSQAFISYIEQVLPSLGDYVRHESLSTLGPVVSTGAVEPANVARVKGDARMASLLRDALAARITPPVARIQIETHVGVRPMSVEDSTSIFKNIRRIPYLVGREEFRTRLAEWALDQPGSPDPEASWFESTVNKLWPTVSPQAFLRELLGSKQRLRAAGEKLFSWEELDLLYRKRAPTLRDEPWTDADVALLDELSHLLEPNRPQFLHIVIDEAQDLSDMQLRAIARRSRTGSYTLAGDVSQATGPWARDSWDSVIRTLNGPQREVLLKTLRLSYRVPRQVMSLARSIMEPVGLGSSLPTSVRDGFDPIRTYSPAAQVAAQAVDRAVEYGNQELFVGIIAPNALHDRIAEALVTRLASNHYADNQISLLSPQTCKGLEFDAVVIVEPASILSSSNEGRRQLYVAMTRTTRYLDLVFSAPCADLQLYPAGKEDSLAPDGDLHGGVDPAENAVVDQILTILADRVPEARRSEVLREVRRRLSALVPDAMSPATGTGHHTNGSE